MLSKIVKWIHAWARCLWRRRARSTPSHTEPSDGHSGEAKSGRPDHKTASDSCDAADGRDGSFEAPLDQTAPNDDETAELPDATDNDHNPPVSTEIESSPPRSGGSRCEMPFDQPEDRSWREDSPSTQSAEDQGSTPNSSAEVGAESQEESSSKDAEPKAPRGYGGRRGGRKTPTQQPPKDDAGAKPQFTPRPELVCRKPSGSWQWEVVLSADDECNIVEVRHRGELLSIVNGEYSLSSLAGSLSIGYEDRESDQLPLSDGMPIVFKSRNDWSGDARKVGGITSGHYVVIAPKDWKRTGPVPVEQEECTDTDFMAHYFYVKKGESAGDVGGFEGCEVVLTRSGLELTGDRVFDDSEDGELFIDAAPKLRPAPGVVWARIGEERGGGWKGENFKPAEQSLADVLNGRQGRFFLRVFDADSNRLDSGEFRYLRDLRVIRVNGEPYTANTLLVPLSAGHSPTEVQFICADGPTIPQILVADETHATVQPEGAVIVASHPKGDQVFCTLSFGTSCVDTVIKLPRIWWQMETDDSESDEWRDTLLVMTRHQFREYAYANSAIRLRLPPRIASVGVGFDADLGRKYPSQSTEDNTTCTVPLADFNDYPEIDQRLNEDALLNVECGEAVLTLIRVSADPVPVIISFTSEPATVNAGETAILHWITRTAEADGVAIGPVIGSVKSSGSVTVTPTETTTFTLRLTGFGMDDVTKDVTVTVRSRLQPGEELVAYVRRRGGSFRRGKGFSRGELGVVGLTAADAARLSISVDRRRRSTHRVNIETIGRSIDA